MTSNELSLEIDLSKIIEPTLFHLTASSLICTKLAKRFMIPSLTQFEAHLHLYQETNFYVLKGDLVATIGLECRRSLEKFSSTLDTSFKLILTSTPMDDEEIDIEILISSKVDIGEISTQYLALAIPLYPLHPRFQSSTEDNVDLSEKEIIIFQDKEEASSIDPYQPFRSALEHFKKK